LDDSATRFVLRQLPQSTRRLLSAIVIAAGIGYLTTVVLAYLAIASPSTVAPDIRELDRLLFGFREHQASLIERLLETTDGPLNRGGSMRPAFTDQSVGWESLTQNMTPDEKAALAAQREGERLALLAWVRSGPNQEAYEANDFRLDDSIAAHPITEAYCVTDQPTSGQSAQRHVRIRSIVVERCVTCHSENGRNEHARWIPLDTFEELEQKCRPEAVGIVQSAWLIAALVALVPLALLTGPLFCLSSTPLKTRRFLTVLTLSALVVSIGSWLLGRQGTLFIYLLLGAAAVAAIGVMMQMVVCVSDLFLNKQA
jgi:hypothetical protein